MAYHEPTHRSMVSVPFGKHDHTATSGSAVKYIYIVIGAILGATIWYAVVYVFDYNRRRRMPVPITSIALVKQPTYYAQLPSNEVPNSPHREYTPYTRTTTEPTISLMRSQFRSEKHPANPLTKSGDPLKSRHRRMQTLLGKDPGYDTFERRRMKSRFNESLRSGSVKPKLV
ncbi:hypothetical protein EDC01DRAFT_486757 [Geopyxis carbonaria]|nr:hypothetical protein EDC01DRAFT_486757 [Geopyxis carbonaria]